MKYVFPLLWSLSENHSLFLRGSVRHQALSPAPGCFFRFIRRGLISNGPFLSFRESITVKSILYLISPALLLCLMLLLFLALGSFYRLFHLHLFWFSLLPNSLSPQWHYAILFLQSGAKRLLCFFAVFRADSMLSWTFSTISLLFPHFCFSCRTFLILRKNKGIHFAICQQRLLYPNMI